MEGGSFSGCFSSLSSFSKTRSLPLEKPAVSRLLPLLVWSLPILVPVSDCSMTLDRFGGGCAKDCCTPLSPADLFSFSFHWFLDFCDYLCASQLKRRNL